MKILLCHNYYQQRGGEDQVFVDEGALLESHGHEVIRFTRHNNDIQSLSLWQTAKATLWNRESYEAIREVIRRDRPDVLHCHNTFPLISPSVYAAANEAGVPVVQTLHNYRLLCPSAQLLRDGRPCQDCLGKRVAWPGILHGCYRGNRPATAVTAAMLTLHHYSGTWQQRVQQYIALSEFSRQKFIEGGLPAERISVKSNFVYPDPGPGTGKGGFAVFVGRLSREKGIETLLAAWRKLNGRLPLKIFGGGPMAEMVGEAAAASPEIEWFGFRQPEEILSVVGEATCLIMPSIWYETFGRTIVEAYAKGTPVIASRMGAMAELVQNGSTGALFEPDNADDLARCINTALDRGALTEMRTAARQEFEEKYTPEANYVQLMEIYGRAGAVTSEGKLPAHAGANGSNGVLNGHGEALDPPRRRGDLNFPAAAAERPRNFP